MYSAIAGHITYRIYRAQGHIFEHSSPILAFLRNLSLMTAMLQTQLKNLSWTLRRDDWQFSLLPCLLGLTYLWIWWADRNSGQGHLPMLFMFAVSATGFAGLGYMINELFDMKQDALAGKVNRAASLSVLALTGLFSMVWLVAFIPWFWLPSDSLTWRLIGCELACLIAYSAPFPRLKSWPIAAEFLDMAYAYLIPALLSLHTFTPLSDSMETPFWQPMLLGGVALVGLRNIIIHRMNDLENDRRAGLVTLPLLIGTRRSVKVVAVLLILEIILLFSAFLMLSSERPAALTYLTVFALFLLWRASSFNSRPIKNPNGVERWRHLPDPFHQVLFPLLVLLMLSWENPWWLAVIPFHSALFLPGYVFQEMVILFRRHAVPVGRLLREKTGPLVNLAIHILFRLFGVDLRKENTDALGYLRGKFRR